MDAAPAGAEYDIDGDPSGLVSDLLPSNGITRNTLVNAFAEANGVVYVGGKFENVQPWAGAPKTRQPYLAAFDVNTGGWISSFRPQLDGPVYSMTVTSDGSKVIVGGEFTGGLIAYSTTTRAVEGSWATKVSWGAGTAGVYDMDLRGNDLYIGGELRQRRPSRGYVHPQPPGQALRQLRCPQRCLETERVPGKC